MHTPLLVLSLVLAVLALGGVLVVILNPLHFAHLTFENGVQLSGDKDSPVVLDTDGITIPKITFSNGMEIDGTERNVVTIENGSTRIASFASSGVASTADIEAVEAITFTNGIVMTGVAATATAPAHISISGPVVVDTLSATSGVSVDGGALTMTAGTNLKFVQSQVNLMQTDGKLSAQTQPAPTSTTSPSTLLTMDGSSLAVQTSAPLQVQGGLTASSAATFSDGANFTGVPPTFTAGLQSSGASTFTGGVAVTTAPMTVTSDLTTYGTLSAHGGAGFGEVGAVFSSHAHFTAGGTFSGAATTFEEAVVVSGDTPITFTSVGTSITPGSGALTVTGTAPLSIASPLQTHGTLDATQITGGSITATTQLTADAGASFPNAVVALKGINAVSGGTVTFTSPVTFNDSIISSGSLNISDSGSLTIDSANAVSFTTPNMSITQNSTGISVVDASGAPVIAMDASDADVSFAGLVSVVGALSLDDSIMFTESDISIDQSSSGSLRAANLHSGATYSQLGTQGWSS